MEEGVWVLFVYGVFVGASDEVIDGAPVATTVLGVGGALVTSFVFSSTVLLAPLHVRVENDCTFSTSFIALSKMSASLPFFFISSSTRAALPRSCTSLPSSSLKSMANLHKDWFSLY